MTRLLLNLVYLDPGRTGGMEVVARQLLPELLAALPSDWELGTIINRRAADSDGPWQDLEMHVVHVDVGNRPIWVAAEMVAVPRVAQRARADLVHSLGNTGPLWTKSRRTATIHDLIHHRIPQPTTISRGARTITGATARRSDRVIVPATQTRDDLVELLGMPTDRIDVVHNGVSPPTVPATPEEELRPRLGLGDRPIVLSPSARQPHKNLPRLLEAHALLSAPRPLLVLPGYPTHSDTELAEQAERLGIAGDVRFLGWVDDADLEGLYLAAELLVFPSLYEGFGLPVAESMLRGLPVACSNRGALAEIAGDAARLFDPEDPQAIATAVQTVLDDHALRTQLIAAGRAQAARFTWHGSADGYVRSFQRALEV